MWRFVQVSDPHLASSRDGVWNHRFLCSMMPEVMDCLARDLAALGPDFILATGDIASDQTREAMFEARDGMESLGAPYYPMGGNHDFVKPESRAWFLEAFAHRLPAPSTYYSFSHKGVHFCVLDAWWLWSDGVLSPVMESAFAGSLDTGLRGMRWAVPPEQFHWLENDLAAHADEPAVIAVHYPALPIPPRLLRPGLNNGGCLHNGRMLMDFLAAFPQVRAVFSGHVHLHFIETHRGIVHVTTGAMPEYPVEYREIQVHEDRMEVTTRGLSNPEFAARSLVEEFRHTAGEARDRSVTIPLIGPRGA